MSLCNNPVDNGCVVAPYLFRNSQGNLKFAHLFRWGDTKVKAVFVHVLDPPITAHTAGVFIHCFLGVNCQTKKIKSNKGQ